jgi:DNA-binding NarL/FixJ family response regulator
MGGHSYLCICAGPVQWWPLETTLAALPGRLVPPPQIAPIRVAIIEDMREVRESLATLINGAAEFQCTGSYRTMEDALSGMAGASPDVILTDIGLPGMNGIDGTRALRARFPDIPVVALSVYDDDDNIFNAICAGASGYLLKNTPPERLLASLLEVVRGGAPMSPEIARRVLAVFRDFQPPARATCHLTPQETTLLKLMVEGHHYKTAADVMDISTSTISFHLKNIYQKLQVHSKTEAVAKALKERLV